MPRLQLLRGWLVLLGLLLSSGALGAQSAGIPTLVDELLRAPDPRAAQAASSNLVTVGASFTEVYRLLSTGRAYSTNVLKGRVSSSRKNADGIEHHYFILVPQEYDPVNK